MTIEDYLKKLANEWEFGDAFPVNEKGVYALPLEDQKITLQITTEGFILQSVICEAPKVKQEEFYTHALLANLFGQGTKFAILSLSMEGTQLHMTRLIDFTIDYAAFRDIIEDFINMNDFWREETLSFV